MAEPRPEAALVGPRPEIAALGPTPRRFVRLHGRRIGDRVYTIATTGAAVAIPAMLVVLGIVIAIAAWPALRHFGWPFLVRSNWDPVQGDFGVAPAIYGTLVTSFLALLIATPLGVGTAVFLTEYAPDWLRRPVGFLTDLLAAVAAHPNKEIAKELYISVRTAETHRARIMAKLDLHDTASLVRYAIRKGIIKA